jgi:CAAX protease family protein
MVVAVIVLGIGAQIAAWALVATRRAGVWTGAAPMIALAGAVALVVRAPASSGDIAAWTAVVAGLASGAVLYAATRVFVGLVARWWPAFTRHAETVYAYGGRAGATAVAAAVVVAAGEELFWRGLTQRELSARLDAVAVAALVTLALYAATNAASRNLAIVAGALVGGAVWGALAWWTGGVLASVLSHATWTALMIVRPAVGRPR